MIKIFCLVGKTGSGKSTFLDIIIHNAIAREINLQRLVYNTTRAKRLGEVDGKDYHFKTMDDFMSEKLDLFNANNIIEARKYNMIDDSVIYYTTKDCLDDGNNYITAASIEQVRNYALYAQKHPEIKVYKIFIDADVKVRMMRILKNRCKEDKDAFELCRRILQENKEYNDEYVVHAIDILIPPEQCYSVYNNTDTIDNAALYTIDHCNYILDWIDSQINQI